MSGEDGVLAALKTLLEAADDIYERLERLTRGADFPTQASIGRYAQDKPRHRDRVRSMLAVIKGEAGYTNDRKAWQWEHQACRYRTKDGQRSTLSRTVLCTYTLATHRCLFHKCPLVKR